MSDPHNLQLSEQIFKMLDRAVWVVTAADQSRRGGLVVTWVTQASLDAAHPTVLIGIASNHFTGELIDITAAFGLHLLRADQVDLAINFGIGSGRMRDKLAGLETETAVTGTPLLTGCQARMDCRVFARLDAGDRIYYWADAVDCELATTGPLLRESQLIAAAGEAGRAQLNSDRSHDIAAHRPLSEQWRANLPETLRPNAR